MVKISRGSVRVMKIFDKVLMYTTLNNWLSPAELMFGRNIRTHIDIIHPYLHKHVTRKQTAQKIQHDMHAV